MSAGRNAGQLVLTDKGGQGQACRRRRKTGTQLRVRIRRRLLGEFRTDSRSTKCSTQTTRRQQKDGDAPVIDLSYQYL